MMLRRVLLLVTVFMFLLSVVAHAAVTTRIIREEERLLSSELQTIEIESPGSVSWNSIGEDEQPYLVIERVVFGFDLEAMEDYLVELRVEEEQFGSGLRLRSLQPSHPPSDRGFPYLASGVTGSTIHLTIYASPDRISDFQVQTRSGDIKVDGFDGELDLETSSGDVQVTAFDGGLTITTSSGDVKLESGEGEICIQTSSGNVDLQAFMLHGSSSIQTSSGNIKGVIGLSAEGNYTFETSSGNVELHIPADVQGLFDLKTRTGTIDFRLSHNLQSLTGQKPFVVITTSSGNIGVGEAH